MNHKTEHKDFKPVESDMPINSATCAGCVFNAGGTPGCIEHACTPETFPEGHPLAGAANAIIWVKKR